MQLTKCGNNIILIFMENPTLRDLLAMKFLCTECKYWKRKNLMLDYNELIIIHSTVVFGTIFIVQTILDVKKPRRGGSLNLGRCSILGIFNTPISPCHKIQISGIISHIILNSLEFETFRGKVFLAFSRLLMRLINKKLIFRIVLEFLLNSSRRFDCQPPTISICHDFCG